MSTLIHTHIHRRHVNTNTNLHAPAHHHQQPHFLCCLHTHACPPVHMHTITLLVMPTLSAIRFSFVSVCGYGSGMSWVGIRWDIPAGANIYAHMCTHMRDTRVHTHPSTLRHTQAHPSTHPDRIAEIRCGAFLVAHALGVPETQWERAFLAWKRHEAGFYFPLFLYRSTGLCVLFSVMPVLGWSLWGTRSRAP